MTQKTFLFRKDYNNNFFLRKQLQSLIRVCLANSHTELIGAGQNQRSIIEPVLQKMFFHSFLSFSFTRKKNFFIFLHFKQPFMINIAAM